MKLQNLKMAGLKLAIGSELIEIDSQGVVEVKDPAVAESLAASGFIALDPKTAKKLEKAAAEAPKAEPEMIKAEEVVREEAKDGPQSKWTRKS